jgi:hypothetical protein
VIGFSVGVIFGVLIGLAVWFVTSLDFAAPLVRERGFENLIHATVVNLDGDSVTIETTNETDYWIWTEQAWAMERRVMGLWFSVPGSAFIGYIRDGLEYAPHEARQLHINFVMHPSMRGGHYRIRRAFYVHPFVPDPVHEFFIPRHDVVAEFYWRP